jgi:hypothetical protein
MLDVDVDNYSISKKLAQFSDLDDDGDLDLVVKIDTSTAKVFINDSKGNFSGQEYIIDTLEDGGVVISDINGDNFPDILASYYTWINDGKAVFSEGKALSIRTDINTFISEYFNNDGSQDLLTTGYWPVLLLNNGNGDFTTSDQDFGTGKPVGIASAADFNGDGNIDLIMNLAPDSAKQIYLYTNDEQADFDTPVLIDETNQSTQFLTVDIDNDGDIDFIRNVGYEIQVYLNQPAS